MAGLGIVATSPALRLPPGVAVARCAHPAAIFNNPSDDFRAKHARHKWHTHTQRRLQADLVRSWSNRVAGPAALPIPWPSSCEDAAGWEQPTLASASSIVHWTPATTVAWRLAQIQWYLHIIAPLAVEWQRGRFRTQCACVSFRTLPENTVGKSQQRQHLHCIRQVDVLNLFWSESQVRSDRRRVDVRPKVAASAASLGRNRQARLVYQKQESRRKMAPAPSPTLFQGVCYWLSPTLTADVRQKVCLFFSSSVCASLCSLICSMTGFSCQNC